MGSFSLNGTNWVYGIGGVIIIAVLLTYEPKWGGWLLILTLLGLLLSPKARALIAVNS